MNNQVMPTGHATETKSTVKSRFSKAASLFSGAVMLLTLLVAGKSGATPIPTTSLSCTQSTTATSSCVVGFFASGWTSGTGAWTYTVNTSGYTGVSMTFNNQRSATGPSTAAVYYNIGGSDVLVTAFTVNTGCTAQTVTLPAACDNQSSLQVKFKMSGATNSGGTHRMPSNGGFDGTSAGSCVSVSAGSVSATATSFCGSGSAILSLAGATSGTGVTYLWESSPTGTGSWTSVGTAATYTTPTLSTTTYYRATVSCSGLNATTAVQAITINSIPVVAPISGPAAPVLIFGTTTLTDATAGGFWSSSNASVASIDPLSGVLTANFGGSTTISYQVSNGSCATTVTYPVYVVWPNTLALYAGQNGTSTYVIPGNSDVNPTALTATGFGSATACGSGGFSGMTIPTSYTTYDSTNPHVGYVIGADAGRTLNAFRIHAITRESSTGPTKARIAYRVYRNGAWGPWIAETADKFQNTGASCGTNSNSWDFTPGMTETGVDSMEVAVFAFGSSANTGTFQLNTLEVYGATSSDIACDAVNFAADSVTPLLVNLCDSGSYWLTYQGAYTGVNGIGVTYQWYDETNIAISGATNASYNTGMLSAYPTNLVKHYYVIASCSGSPIKTSFANTVTVTQKPVAGTITGLPSYSVPGTGVTFNKTLVIGNDSTLGASYVTPIPGEYTWWSSNDTSAISIDSATGLAHGIIPGFALITAHRVVNGCTITFRDSLSSILDQTIAAYIGLGGNSTAVNNYVPAKISVEPLAQSGFTVATPCSFGGFSGLTTNATGYTSAGPRAFFKLKANAVTGTQDLYFNATVRVSSTGPTALTMAYSKDNGATWTAETINHTTEIDGCGYSTINKFYGEINGDATPSVTNGDSILFGLFAYASVATSGTFQVNTIDITANDASALKPAAQSAIAAISDVQIYPNPASTTLNVRAAEVVNVTVMSVDGKILVQQKDAKQINVSNLASGLYLIKIMNSENQVIKTTSFSKL